MMAHSTGSFLSPGMRRARAQVKVTLNFADVGVSDPRRCLLPLRAE
jgi:hypothetical protein